jgi:hypothetical protein
MTLDELERAVIRMTDDPDTASAIVQCFDAYKLTGANPEPEYVLPTRKTGVIVGVDGNHSRSTLDAIAATLRDTFFPGVTVAVIPGAQSVAFEWAEA